ncbi:urea transporter DVU1160-like [Belonocnema kinseyi]|uniref:urea transporter DVU1160-like n=1 Tax=Belonocnema kinseyi TaxID=2817044 RepID=UPI00143D5C15|nr:urea transporter DVU1160-like [Belonocnema kinseyi]
MSREEIRTKFRSIEYEGRFVFGGDFALLKDFLSKKDSTLWVPLQLLDALLRGFGQATCANNPISGLLVVIALGVASPGLLVLSIATGLLGLLLSILIREPSESVENGLTVFNPLLVGALAYAFVPKMYGPFDAFSLLLLFFSTIFSVYLTRSAGSGKLPSLTFPYVVVELMLLFILKEHNGGFQYIETSMQNITINNGTRSVTMDDTSTIVGKGDAVSPDWGMIFRGVVTSASQVYGVDDVALGSVVYLALIIYSPITTAFSFAGALIGSLLGLELDISYEIIYSGVWGFNGLLTGAALGGNFLIINKHASIATVVAIAFTTILQYIIYIILNKYQLPYLSMPFVISTWLFLCLAKSREDTFIFSSIQSYPEKQKYEFLHRQRMGRMREVDDESETF